MGYTTKFTGQLSFTREMTAGELEIIHSFFGEDCRDHPEWNVQGLTYLDFCFADDYSGILHDGSEKTYDFTEKVNSLIREVQKQIPDFGLTGEILAQGEERNDRWKCVMQNNIAVKVPIES